MNDPHGDLSLRTDRLASATVLVDCRWLGLSGIGKATELLLRALAEDPPPGRWLLWGGEAASSMAWPGAEVVTDRRDPHRRLGQIGIWSRPAHDVAVYPSQLRPAGRRPSVQYLHDVTPVTSERRPVPRLLKRAYFRLLGRATRLVAGSAAAATEVSEVLAIAADRIEVLRYPVDEAASERIRLRRTGTGTADELLFVGRAAPYKNLDRLIEAHRRSLWEGSLVLVGPGTERHDGAGPRVVGLGHVDDDRLEERYAMARALVLPSLSEGFGLPILEAQAAGLPVLVSNRPPMGDLAITGFDVTFDPLDVGDIARALDRLAGGELPPPGPRPTCGGTLAEHRAFILRAVEQAVTTGSGRRHP